MVQIFKHVLKVIDQFALHYLYCQNYSENSTFMIMVTMCHVVNRCTLQF